MGQLHVEAKGSVSACPDTAHVHCAILTKDAKMERALQSNNASSTKVLEQLQAAGIQTEQDVQTTGFRAEPIHKALQGRNLKKIEYFQVINSLNIKVRDLCALGRVLTTLGEEENIKVQLGNFTNSNADELLDQARQRAVACAIKRAELYTKSAGITLKGIESISEQHMHYGGGMGHRAMAFADSISECADVPVCEGEQDHAVNITVVFNIGNEAPSSTAETPLS